MNAYPDLCITSAADQLAATHLTDDQIDDHLIGDLAPLPTEHLATCALCAERVTSARSPLESFDSVSTAWSERRSATLPIPVPTQSRPLWQRNSAWATACLALAFGVALTNASHQLTIQPAAPASSPSQTAALATDAQPVALHATAARPVAFTETASIAPSRAARISADNRMLRSMTAAFDPSPDSPAALGLVSENSSTNRAPASLQNLSVQD